ncbi:MAG: TRAP transporter fused permease subunit, partial [Synergistetes bacterium]|nr:TRAP transporter fused permease subunit [Synergistota bacterium]
MSILGENGREKLVSVIAIGMSLFHLATGYYQLEAMSQRIIHLMFAYTLIYLTCPKSRDCGRFCWILRLSLALLYVIVSMYFLFTWDKRMGQIGLSLPLCDIVLGIAILALSLEGARRIIGIVLPAIAVLVIIYARFGEIMPDLFAHANYPIDRIVYSMSLKTDGLYGMLTGISATFIYLLVLFGTMYKESGAGKFFMDFAMSLAGGLRGGAGKVAVVASSLFGMISGSGVANTAATGSITIPLMVREGYPSYFAAAVVAASGSGGLIMPPIMGSAVFIIMQILGIPYTEIMLRSFIIAVLFYLALFLTVDIESVKLGIRGRNRLELPDTVQVIKEGWNYLIPPLLLIVLLLLHFTVTRAAFWGCLSIPLASALRKSTRMGWEKLLSSLREGALSAISVIAILSTASIVVGVVNFTGLGLMVSSILINLSGGNLFLLLVLTMIASIILGMGIPPVAAYIVLAILVVPALTQMGIWPFAAHMFVFYFSVLAEISPPVAP